MKKIILFTLLISILIFSFLLNKKAIAEGHYFNLTINGNYQTSYSSTYKNTQLTWGVELGIPLFQYLELSLGKSYTKDTYEYTDDYKNSLTNKGLVLPAGTLTQENDTSDTYINLTLSPIWTYINPSIFGGFLMRNVCSRDYFGDNTCENQALTWNAGGAISFYLSQYLRIKFSYKISPSGYSLNQKKYYDETITAGITFVY
ncbi:hypothetical protein [Fluviispira multicolorata]|uniref:Outer membrane protein beta-barrel domain-containing protein n=1 Tax=Fluviispira multicolorata TaxID=2654512 RepID=A0A833JI51_9BACT|nr:hypothetical protein [Fluviispira multicolorata]KAB8033777.1 hypothetical protein GCL57_03455 [Fluviispira multicolorata]